MRKSKPPPPTAPGDVVLPAKKEAPQKLDYNVKQLRKYLEAGLTNDEIADKMDVSRSSVTKWIKESGLLGIRPRGRKKKNPTAAKPEVKKAVSAGHNADRHLCKTCRFRSSKEDKRRGFGCDYIEIVGHSRRCDIEDCDVYEKGDPSQKGKKLTLK